MNTRAVCLLACLIGVGHVASATNAAGKAFLEENRNKEGVVELPSGLQVRGLFRRAAHCS